MPLSVAQDSRQPLAQPGPSRWASPLPSATGTGGLSRLPSPGLRPLLPTPLFTRAAHIMLTTPAPRAPA